jgi:hypothetical protein
MRHYHQFHRLCVVKMNVGARLDWDFLRESFFSSFVRR